MKNKILLKTLSTFLAVLILLCSAPLSGFVGIELPDLFSLKAEAYTEGNFTYSVYSGEATLTGCIDATGDIVIPETLGGYPVTGIGDYAFFGCTSLTSITIPDSVTSIDGYAFFGCTSLASVTIPDSVTSIDGYAFFGCTSLTSITIPDSITSIGDGAFHDCTSLASVTIGNSVTIIGDYTFEDCTSLTSVTIPDSVTSIGGSAFRNCTSLASVTLGNGVTSIGYSAFEDCTNLARVYYSGDIESWCGIEFGGSYANPMYYAKNFYIDNTLVKEIIIPDTVTEIKDYTFYGFKGVTSVTIPDSVVRIGDCAFENCTSLTSVAIPDSVTSMCECVFSGCASLKDVTIGNGVKNIENSAFRGCMSLKSFDIPDNVTRIGECAFEDCGSLETVVVGDGVTSIEGCAFYNCFAIDSLTIGKNVIKISQSAFGGHDPLGGGYDVHYTGDIASWCSISFEDDTAFSSESNPIYYCENFYINGELVENIIIPNEFVIIKANSFKGYKKLKSVTIPASVITIRKNAFYDCDNIETVYYAGTDEQWDEIIIYDGNECLNLADKTFLNGGHAHVYNSTVAVEPTCTESGLKALKCYCGDSYTEVIPETGHVWGKWVVTLEPTATKDGRKVRACTVCVEAIQEEVIPKGTNPDIPDEPDEPETESEVKVSDFTLNYKGTGKINPEINVSGKYTVDYVSSDETIVTVDKDGNVTATGEGTAEITVIVTDEKGNLFADTCKVTVTKAWWQWLIIIFLFGWIWYI